MWMLGCVLYVLCTGNRHPFQDAPNLAILNASYEMNETQSDNLANCSAGLKDLIRAMLVTNPAERLSLNKLKSYLLQLQLDQTTQVDLCEEAMLAKRKQMQKNERLKATNSYKTTPTLTTEQIKPNLQTNNPSTSQQLMELPEESLDNDDTMWWQQEGEGDTNIEDQSEDDSFGEFHQAHLKSSSAIKLSTADPLKNEVMTIIAQPAISSYQLDVDLQPAAYALDDEVSDEDETAPNTESN